MKPQIYRNSFPANLCFQRMRLLVAVALVALPLFWNVTVRTETAAGEFYPITGNDVLVTTSALSGAPIAATITFTVINTNDSGPGTLRQAILDANDNLGADIIAFGIPGPGPHTIAPTTALPEVTDPLTIDGTTQPGYSGKPVIELSGVNAGIGVDGLCVIFPGTVIRALAINRFGGNGIKLVEGDDTLIVGNFIGTDVTGTIGLGNGGSGIFSTNDGLKVGGWTPAARNVISGNGRYGIETSGGGPTIVEGNLIGTDVTGTKPLGNSAGGVSLFGGVFNRVGGTTDGSRNVISANGGIGLECFLAGEVMIQGNHIGTDVSGRRPLGNAGDGVVVSESSSLIGGPTPSSRNIISANGGSGIRTGMGEETNRIEGNFIGTDVTGTRDLGNAGDGVVMNDIAGALGGATPEFGNLISGNDGNGVTLNRFHTSVSNNLIGTDRSGTRPLGNSRNGIFIANGDNSIESNTIAFNGEAGVLDLGPEAQDLFLFNSIFSNGGIGIDLGSTAPAADGPTPNDPCDVDDGPNHLQNFPVLTAVSLSAGGIRVEGELNSEPNTTFTLQFFANRACDPSGFGEGERFAGSITVTTDGNCVARFSAPLGPVPPGSFITATATTPLNGTSEFSACIRVPTPQELIRGIISDVEQLVASGELNPGQGNALNAKLRAAIQQIDRGNFVAARNQLNAFINQVNALVMSRRLTPAHGDHLKGAANAVLSLLSQ